MKLSKELPGMVQKFTDILPLIEESAPVLYRKQGYNDFVVSLAFVCFRTVYRGEERCAYYDYLQENYPEYNDKHLTTLLKTALLTVYPKAANMEGK